MRRPASRLRGRMWRYCGKRELSLPASPAITHVTSAFMRQPQLRTLKGTSIFRGGGNGRRTTFTTSIHLFLFTRKTTYRLRLSWSRHPTTVPENAYTSDTH